MRSGGAEREGLLETIKDAIGCTYISDLRFGNINKMGRAEFAALGAPEAYSLRELSDAACYLFAEEVSFESYDSVRAFQKNKKARR